MFQIDNFILNNPTKIEELIRGMHILYMLFRVKYITLTNIAFHQSQNLPKSRKTIGVQSTLSMHTSCSLPVPCVLTSPLTDAPNYSTRLNMRAFLGIKRKLPIF